MTRGGSPIEPEYARRLAPSRIVFEVKTKSRQLIEKLRSGPKKLSELYSECESRSEIVATFISVLELCSIGSVLISGDDGEYVLEFVGGDTEDILEKIVE